MAKRPHEHGRVDAATLGYLVHKQLDFLRGASRRCSHERRALSVLEDRSPAPLAEHVGNEAGRGQHRAKSIDKDVARGGRQLLAREK